MLSSFKSCDFNSPFNGPALPRWLDLGYRSASLRKKEQEKNYVYSNNGKYYYKVIIENTIERIRDWILRNKREFNARLINRVPVSRLDANNKSIKRNNQTRSRIIISAVPINIQCLQSRIDRCRIKESFRQILCISI